MIWLASICENVDCIDCKGHKIAFLGKEKLLLPPCQILECSIFSLKLFTYNVKSSFTENTYLHNLHRAVLTQKRKCKSSLFKPGKNYVGIFIVMGTVRMLTLNFTQFTVAVNCVFDNAVVYA